MHEKTSFRLQGNMCLSPNFIKELGVFTGCRKCWQCIEKAQLDWVGRCIAEYKSPTTTSAHYVTLTYGRDPDNSPDHAHAKVLFYSDVQKWFKRLRKRGYKFRYMVTGEYGSEYGRAHWNVLMFWQGKAPEHEKLKRVVQAHWDLGWSYWDDVTVKSVRYVCKYIQKDQTDEEMQTQMAMSKTPPLGTAYFKRLAERHVSEGVAPQDWFYTFPEALRRNGERLIFRLQGKTAKDFLYHFVLEWKKKRKRQNIPNSKIVEEFLDSRAKERWPLGWVEVTPKAETQKLRKPERPLWADEFGFSEKHNAWYAMDLSHGDKLYWSFNKEGLQGWHARIEEVEDVVADGLSSRSGLKRDKSTGKQGRERTEKPPQSRGDEKPTNQRSTRQKRLYEQIWQDKRLVGERAGKDRATKLDRFRASP